MASLKARGVGTPMLSDLVKSASTKQQSTPQEQKGHEEGSEEGEEEEVEEEGSEEDEDELIANASPYEEEDEILFEVQALSNFVAEEDGDLGFKVREILAVLESSRDDGWLLAENALGERGLIPCNYVQRLPPADDPSRAASPIANTSLTPRRGRDLWAKLRTTVKQTTLADVLSAMGAVPSGFRDSTLAKLLRGSSAYLTSTWVFPTPSPTGIAFKDLKWNHSKDQLQSKTVKVTREFAILAARMIPLPGKGVQILSRHVRIAIFNKNDILSNIHTMRATWNPHEEKSWRFASKAQTTANCNSLYHQVCVARVDSSDPNIELLCELGVTFKREKTGEVGELSCGWSSLPLFEHSGNPAHNKTYELKVHGGTPFESGIEVDAAASTRASGGRFPSILRANQTPRLYIRLLNLPRNEKATCSLLPSTLITSSLYVKPIGCFRQLVGEAFLRGRLGLTLPNYVTKPSLNVFLKALDQPDVMDSVVGLWNERMKAARRVDKQNLKYMSDQLEKVLLEHTYPLTHSLSLPSPLWADEQREQERLRFIEEFSRKPHLSKMLAADTNQTATNITEQIFSIYLS